MGSSLVFGYEKIRHYHPDFRNGSFYRSVWKPTLLEPVIGLRQKIGYYGFAGVKFIRDPRDGKYKLLEINAITERYGI